MVLSPPCNTLVAHPLALSHTSLSDAKLLFLACAGEDQQSSCVGDEWKLYRCGFWPRVFLALNLVTSVVSLFIPLCCLILSFSKSLCCWPTKSIQHVPHKGLPLKTQLGRTFGHTVLQWGGLPLLHLLCLWMTILQMANLKKTPTNPLPYYHLNLCFCALVCQDIGTAWQDHTYCPLTKR